VKLPYRLGDSFALPLGNGQFARSCIVQCEHRVVVIRAWIGEESWLDLRVSDDAFVLHRWQRDGNIDLNGTPQPQPENRYWMHAARAERLVAAALGAPHPRERKIRVRELRDDNAAIALTELDDDCVLTLTERVSNATLERICAAIRNHPRVMIRLDGEAATQLDTLAETPVTRCSLAGSVQRIPPITTLRHLDLEDASQLDAVASAFPNLESLRVSQRGAAVNIQSLTSLRNLRSLDLSLVHVADAACFAQLAQLRALRLNRMTGMTTMDALAPLTLRMLAVEHLYQLQRVESLARISSLEQVELRGLWQFEIAGVQWALECERLMRAEIDIGGRRKNVELYRRAHWAYPWRF